MVSWCFARIPCFLMGCTVYEVLVVTCRFDAPATNRQSVALNGSTCRCYAGPVGEVGSPLPTTAASVEGRVNGLACKNTFVCARTTLHVGTTGTCSTRRRSSRRRLSTWPCRGGRSLSLCSETWIATRRTGTSSTTSTRSSFGTRFDRSTAWPSRTCTTLGRGRCTWRLTTTPRCTTSRFVCRLFARGGGVICGICGLSLDDDDDCLID